MKILSFLRKENFWKQWKKKLSMVVQHMKRKYIWMKNSLLHIWILSVECKSSVMNEIKKNLKVEGNILFRPSWITRIVDNFEIEGNFELWKCAGQKLRSFDADNFLKWFLQKYQWLRKKITNDFRKTIGKKKKSKKEWRVKRDKKMSKTFQKKRKIIGKLIWTREPIFPSFTSKIHPPLSITAERDLVYLYVQLNDWKKNFTWFTLSF